MTNEERLWFVQNEYNQPSRQPFGLGAVAGQLGATVYRFIVVNPDGSCDTGANYAGCNSSLGQAAFQAGSPCQPQHFASLNDALHYASAHGEIPYRVASGDEAFAIADGKVAPSAAQIIPWSQMTQSDAGFLSNLSMPMLAALGIGAYLLLGKKRTA